MKIFDFIRKSSCVTLNKFLYISFLFLFLLVSFTGPNLKIQEDSSDRCFFPCTMSPFFLASFISHDVIEVHSYCRSFISFHCWAVFHFRHVPWFINHFKGLGFFLPIFWCLWIKLLWNHYDFKHPHACWVVWFFIFMLPFYITMCYLLF